MLEKKYIVFNQFAANLYPSKNRKKKINSHLTMSLWGNYLCSWAAVILSPLSNSDKNDASDVSIYFDYGGDGVGIYIVKLNSKFWNGLNQVIISLREVTLK